MAWSWTARQRTLLQQRPAPRGAKPSTDSEGLLARLAASGWTFTADDITFSVRTMLDENAHALPGSLAALKSIAGLDRVQWEYYKACAAKKPVYGKRARMSFGPDSYIGQLHASLAELLDPRVVQSAKHMHSPKALRDFIVSWCFFWQCCRPPFQNGGARGQWVCDQWEELPMHEIFVLLSAVAKRVISVFYYNIKPEKGLLKTLTAGAGKSLYSTKIISWVLSRVTNDVLLHVYKSLHDVREVEAQCDAESTKRR